MLIINYDFPPYGGIGGRRWAKFAKYLFKSQVDFTVLTYQNSSKKSPWGVDVLNFKHAIEYINGNYPTVVDSVPTTLIQKIKYRIAILKLKFFTTGNFYDKTCLDGSLIKNRVEELLKQKKITDVVVSVAPFRLAFYISELIPKYPQINFVVDFRDPWTVNKTSYGYSYLTKNKQEQEKEMERKVISKFNKVVSVAPEMTKYFQTLDPSNTDKFHTVINGYDLEELIGIDAKKPEVTEELNLVFTGTFYNNTGYLVKEFTSALEILEKDYYSVYKSIKFNFYGANSKVIAALSNRFLPIIDHDTVPKESIAKIINEADGGLIFLSEDITYSFSTKFCEYLALKKPIIVFSKTGYTSKYVNDNGIGHVVRSGHVLEDLLSFYRTWQENNALNFDESFDTSKFDIAYLTEQYLKILST